MAYQRRKMHRNIVVQGMGQSIAGISQNAGNFQMMVGQANNSIGGQPSSGLIPIHIQQQADPGSATSHHGHQTSIIMNQNNENQQVPAIVNTGAIQTGKQSILSINSPVVGMLTNPAGVGDNFSTHLQQQQLVQKGQNHQGGKTFTTVLPIQVNVQNAQQPLQQSLKATSSLSAGTTAAQVQAANALYLVQTPQGQQAIAFHQAQIGNRPTLMKGGYQQVQQRQQQAGSEATTSASTGQVSTQSGNAQNLVSVQAQNQAALRFQLNSKRYSNLKEGPMVQQQQASQTQQNPPSRESVLRHRLGKKQQQEMYYYHLQPKYATNQATAPPQQAQFSKTMGNFGPNAQVVSAQGGTFNLNGQKLIMQGNQASQGLLLKDYDQLSGQGGPPAPQPRPAATGAASTADSPFQLQPGQQQFMMSQKSELSIADGGGAVSTGSMHPGSAVKRQPLALRNVQQSMVGGINGQNIQNLQHQQRTQQNFHTSHERPQSHNNRLANQQPLQHPAASHHQQQQLMAALYLQNNPHLAQHPGQPPSAQALQTPQQETKLKLLFQQQQPVSSGRQSQSQAPVAKNTVQYVTTNVSAAQTQKLMSMKHMHLQQMRMEAGQASASSIPGAGDSSGQARDQSLGKLPGTGQQAQSAQPQQLLVPTQGQQKQINLIRASTQQNQIKFIKNQLCQISKLMQDDDGNEQDVGSQRGDDSATTPAQNLHSFTQQKLRNASPGIVFASKQLAESPDAVKSSLMMQNQQKDFGMTLEDDVESMLSDQFNTSNESMFKVRLHSSNVGGNQLGTGLAAGDSTYRCNESAQDDDRGLISESEDGWFADKDPKAANPERQDDFEDISEHSSDERTDSSGGLEDPQGVIVVKKKKNKGEKGEKKKKKKKKALQNEEAGANAEKDGGKGQAANNKGEDSEPAKKLIHQYKKLQEDTKEKKERDHGHAQGRGKQESTKDSKKPDKESKTAKKPNAVNEQTKIKIAVQPKGGKNEKAPGGGNDPKVQRNDDKRKDKDESNNFNSPNIKNKMDMKKMNSDQPKVKGESIAPHNKKVDPLNKTEKADPKAAGGQSDKKGDAEKSGGNQVAQTPMKKPKKNGFKLQALNHALPKNLQECYDRFFEADCKINPQFEYENAQTAQRFLEQFCEPDGRYLEVAKQILDSFLQEYGSESHYLECEGRKLNQDETHQYIRDYLANLGVEEWISINFQKNQVAPTSVTHDPKTGKCKMNIKLPCEYREGRMIGVLDHEIGTHFLRKHNEKLQQWYKKRDKFDMKTCIATEEGLACTNQMVQTVKDGKCKPFLYRSALNYYAAYMAKELSFVDLFKDLEKYVDSPQARWKFCLRVKRGLVDTSQKGGLYKDQVYLEGAVKILARRKRLNFKALLCGKISLDDYDRECIFSILCYEGQLLPPFMEDMDEYYHCLDVIGETNHIAAEDDERIEENKAHSSADQTAQQMQEVIAGESSARGAEPPGDEHMQLSPREDADNILPEVDHRRKESAQWLPSQLGDSNNDVPVPNMSPGQGRVAGLELFSQAQLAQSAGLKEVGQQLGAAAPLGTLQPIAAGEHTVSQFPPVIVDPAQAAQAGNHGYQTINDSRLLEYTHHRFDGGGDQFQLPGFMVGAVAQDQTSLSLKISPRASELNQLASGMGLAGQAAFAGSALGQSQKMDQMISVLGPGQIATMTAPASGADPSRPRDTSAD